MGCPGDSQLALVLEGRMPDGEATNLRRHIATCASCSALTQLLEGRASTHPPSVTASPQGLLSTPLSPPAPANPPRSPGPRSPSADAVALARAFDLEGLVAAPALARPGDLLGGRFRLESKLGEGGMGTVWAAEHVVTGERVALKVIRPQQAHNPTMRRRMLREARTASAVRHPNVVRVIDVFEIDGGSPVLVMDLLQGRTLRQRMLEGPLSVAEAARVLVPAMAAVQSAHAAGVIHRDLKPDNLFLVRLRDGVEDVRVLDFGLARFIAVDANSSQLTRSGEMLGTPCYMSPEQAFGETELDARTDVWAMGVILFECLSGQRPFDGGNFGQVLKRITSGQHPSLQQLAPTVPADVLAVIERMLTVAQADRPTDLRDAIEVLSRHAGGPISAPVRRVRRRGWLVAGGGAVLALTLVAAGLTAPKWLPGPSTPAATTASPGRPPPPTGTTELPGDRAANAAAPAAPTTAPAAPAATPSVTLGSPPGAQVTAGTIPAPSSTPGASSAAATGPGRPLPIRGGRSTARPDLRAAPLPGARPRTDEPTRPPRIEKADDL